MQTIEEQAGYVFPAIRIKVSAADITYEEGIASDCAQRTLTRIQMGEGYGNRIVSVTWSFQSPEPQ
ncbi:MAG: hypothetical protein ACSLE5_13530 [Porticoccaceae bacterium]